MREDFVDVPFRAQAEDGGCRVDAFLARRLKRYSRSEVQRLIRQGRVRLEDLPVKPASRVRGGQTVSVRYPRRQEPPVLHASLPVLFEDERLVAVCKPGGLLTHPTDKVLLNTATSVLSRQFPGAVLRLVHRLDRETSGVLLLAKDREAARLLVEAFTRRRVEKRYLAAVSGIFPEGPLRSELPIGPDGGEIKVRQAAGRGGRLASTEFRRVSAGGGASLVLARPLTGRLHQVRVHLAALGHPVLGDKLYAGSGEAYLKAVRRELLPEDLSALGAPRQMLHALTLRLAHPGSGVPLLLRAEPPEDFLDCLRSRGLNLCNI